MLHLVTVGEYMIVAIVYWNKQSLYELIAKAKQIDKLRMLVRVYTPTVILCF